MSGTSGPPSWLFSNNTTNNTKAGPLAASATSLASLQSDEMAKKSFKPASSSSKAVEAGAAPSADLLSLVGNFLTEHSFTKTHGAFRKEVEKNGWAIAKKNSEETLVSVFEAWETARHGEAESENDTDGVSSDESSSSSDDSDSDSESETKSEVEKKTSKKSAAPAKAVPATGSSLKRKAPAESASSDSDTSSDSDAAPRAKKLRTEKATASSDSESSSSDSASDTGNMDVDQDSSESSSSEGESDSDSSSSSESESESDSDSDDGKAEAEAAAKIALPESDSSSSGSSSSDSDSEDEKPKPKPKPKPKKTTKKSKVSPSKDSSGSSVTLDEQSPAPQRKDVEPPLPPDPILMGPKKKQNEPFSRIPKNVKVSPKFSSNAYVPVSYSQRAHQDLIVTKGKGFTKEKNKKKRGSFRGGAIDISHSGSIYFDD